ncbi:oxygenase MpaB family protein [Rhodococcus sp. NCIMB 12038]|uniref:oxygenase MpaB family protein n=1 Tax=Rhodococcus sp. NCIMB 12038 TaxID=933800 RepID=UPI000B3C8905|nr:oxygenase MpaB family protein [Rhodococcus sp. NCIMB 12038]OUS94385.1 hypothetical protein CA951_18475 [Rhodococcus sp. NCIMB 12038]
MAGPPMHAGGRAVSGVPNERCFSYRTTNDLRPKTGKCCFHHTTNFGGSGTSHRPSEVRIEGERGAMARTKPYKWIAREIEKLDPKTDYETIWKLSSIYYINDFLADYIYAITFPNFIVPQRGAQAVLREGTGKVYTDPNRRMDDTTRHMLVWWENGPSDIKTQRSVQSLNNLHKYYARKYPGNFGYNEDYIYTLCYEAALMHRLRLKLGMNGISEKQQQAAWEFWSRMAKLFVNADSGAELHGFPEDFAGINAFMDEYEGKNWPDNPLGADVTERMLGPFAERYFPRLLHPLARTLVLAMYNDTVLRVHNMPRPRPITRKLVRLGVRFGLTLSEKVLPDPQESLPEIHRRRKAVARSLDHQAAVSPLGGGGQCPHPAGQAVVSEPIEVVEARKANATG